MHVQPDCNALLAKVCQIYQEIELIYLNMMDELPKSTSSAIIEAANTLDALLKKAKTIDDLIAENMDPNSLQNESTQMLLRNRDAILQQLQRLNRTLASRAENIKTLVLHEIGNMTKNRTALKGYKNLDTETKGIIRNAI